MSVLGTRVKRKEDPVFLTTGGTYTADVRDPRLDGAMHATFVRSTMAHARIIELDVTEARTAPGVVAVFTNDDLDDFAAPRSGMPGFIPDEMARPWLANGIVRFVGEPIAVVLTEQHLVAVEEVDLAQQLLLLANGHAHQRDIAGLGAAAQAARLGGGNRDDARARGGGRLPTGAYAGFEALLVLDQLLGQTLTRDLRADESFTLESVKQTSDRAAAGV